MQRAEYYREHAARARRLAGALDDVKLRSEFERMAGDYEDIAEDLERGLIDIKHPEALPQRR